MPEWAQNLADFLPFRWTFGYPITALVGPISDRDLYLGLLAQAVWIARRRARCVVDVAASGPEVHGGGRMRLAWLFLRVGVMNELQYRANFFIQLLQSLVAIATGLIVLALIFDKTDDLAGWTRPQLLVVMGVFTIIGGVIGFAIEPNMARLMTDVRMGTFDYTLTKPVDVQLLVSVREFRIWKLTDVLVGGCVLLWGISQLTSSVGWSAAAGFAGTIVLGGGMVYCFWLILTTGAFWFVRMEMLQELFTGLYRAGQYPATIYPGWLRFSLTFLVPLAFAITVPSEALTGRLTVLRVVVTVGFAVGLFVVTRIIWRTGLKHYSGASA